MSRVVIFVGPYREFADYVEGEIAKLSSPDGKLRPPSMRYLNGREVVLTGGGRTFKHVHAPWAVDQIRGRTAAHVDLVVSETVPSDSTWLKILRGHVVVMTMGAPPEAVERERMISQVMAETDEPYEIVVEAVDALAACNDYPDES